MIGVAAALAILAGLAWQFRPAGEPAPPAVEDEALAAPVPAAPLVTGGSGPAHPAEQATPRGEDDGGVVFDRQQLHDLPPATVDSPGIHHAWLERIRELREAGDTGAALESLREYRRRYPDQPLPDDLHGLLDQ